MKKFWKALAAIGISAALCVPLAACGEDGATTDQERLYESYVLYAQAAGDEVLSYQEWLDSVRGAAGEDGKSAYEIAVENGFEGTEEEWLASLKGQDGEDGKNGADGDKGDKGDAGEKGEQGDKGDKGDPGEKGDQGDKGDPGEKGEQGVGIKDITYSYGYNAEEGYFYTEITFILTNEQEETVIVPSAMNPKTTYVATTAAAVESLMAAGVENISLGADIEMNLVIAEGQELALDLNGHTLTNAGDHTIYNSGTLTVADSVGSGVVDNVTNGRGALVNYGTAILNGGTFTRSKETGKVSAGQNSWYAVLNQGTMTINVGVTVYTEENVSNYSSLIVNGLEGNKTYPLPSGKDSAFMTVNGGTFTGGVATLKNDYYGVLTVVGGTFSGAGSDMSVQNWGIMTVSAGELSSPVFEQEIGAYTQGEDYRKGTTTVSGGTFLGGLGGYEYVDGANDTPVFDKNNIAVSGGTFAEALNEAFVAEGYEAVAQDGVWVVTPKQA